MAKRARIKASAVIRKNLEAALERLGAISADADAAVATRSKAAKKSLAEVKRMNKRRGVLLRKKKTASNRAKKAPSRETKSALRAVERELVVTRKALVKARAVKAANADELAGAKASQRQLNAYNKATAAADRALNRSRKKR